MVWVLPPYAQATSVLAQSILRPLPSQRFLVDSILNAGRFGCFGSTEVDCEESRMRKILRASEE